MKVAHCIVISCLFFSCIISFGAHLVVVYKCIYHWLWNFNINTLLCTHTYIKYKQCIFCWAVCVQNFIHEHSIAHTWNILTSYCVLWREQIQLGCPSCNFTYSTQDDTNLWSNIICCYGNGHSSLKRKHKSSYQT